MEETKKYNKELLQKKCVSKSLEGMNDVRRVIVMVKYAAKRSGSRFVMVRDGWKLLVVNNLMYSSGALTWYEKEYDELERMQGEMGRWIWGCKLYVKNELVCGETRWRSFKEREVEAKIKWLIIFQ